MVIELFILKLLLYVERVDSEVRSRHPISKANPNRSLRYFRVIKTTRNSRITTKVKIGPFLANKMINIAEDIRLRISVSLKGAEQFRVSKIVGLVERRISDAPAGRGFSEKSIISPL